MSQREELEEQSHRRDGRARAGGMGGLCCSQAFSASARTGLGPGVLQTSPISTSLELQETVS